MDEPSDRMTQPRGIGPARQTQAGRLPKRLERAVSWSDFRTAVRYDPANRMLLAVPAISAKRAEHPRLGDAVTVHLRIGEAEVYRRDYEHGSITWSAARGAEVAVAASPAADESGADGEALDRVRSGVAPLA